MKFQLTINTSYCPSWGLWEGVREIVQNALDAHDRGHEMKLSFRNNTLRVSNLGVRLEKNVWLMGSTTKLGRDDQRGQFGEGLKLGVLALIRDGHDVKIINDNESWSPSLEESDIFKGEKVLSISTRARESEGRFVVEVYGINAETWEEMSKRFLFLHKPKKIESTYAADILLDNDLKGMVFVKGIHVKNNSLLDAGYDLKNAEVDRDRRMVDEYDQRQAMMGAWSEVATRTPSYFTRLVEMLEKAAPDLAGLNRYSTPDALRAQLQAQFVAKYGENAMPVTNMAEAMEVEHFGRRGVVLPTNLVEILNRESGGVAKLRESFRHATLKTYSPDELSTSEMDFFNEAQRLTKRALDGLGFDTLLNNVNVVDFVQGGLLGLYSSDTREIKVAKKCLVSFEETLQTIVHEVAHNFGGDGQKGHEEMEGKIFARIVKDLVDEANGLRLLIDKN